MEKKTVMIVDDSRTVAWILRETLESLGYRVRCAYSGEDALDMIDTQRPDLVILDVKMPGLDGFEVLDRLRRDARFASVPIVMLTSMGQEADVVRGFGLGADDYVLKPFSPVELMARVRRLVQRGRSARAI